MASRNKNNLPKQLIMSAAIAATFISGYGVRRAYAGACTGAAGTYTCSGAANAGSDTTQTLVSNANPLTVTTTAGFGINTVSGNAISLLNIGDGSSINFTDNFTSSITGATIGISALGQGKGGATSITSTGMVTGGQFGIDARNNSTSTNLTISTAAVSGYGIGIRAQNLGTGATSITSTGLVTGTTSSGISAYNSLTATDLTVSTAAVTGRTGISVFNNGKGATSVTSSGMVTGTNGDGIALRNYTAGSSITINTAAVTGGGRGIDVDNVGNGATSITSTGMVTGGQIGINARNRLNTTDLTISAAAVTGGDGIRLQNYGKGATSITSTGVVTGTGGYGINAYSATSTAGLTINAVDVTGGSSGIRVVSNGKGATSITSTGTVTGSSGTGIRATSTANSTGLTISTATVTSEENGIVTSNYGKGATSITSTGNVTSTDGYGILARNESTATNLTINSAAVTGYETGIYAINRGTGATSITSSGLVTGGEYYSGIDARNESAATNLTITAVAVTGGSFGINADNSGKGATSITSTGLVTSNYGDGINAYNGNYTTDLTISSAAVSGSRRGIDARNFGTGATSITVNGAVTGGGGKGDAGIYNRSINASTITLNSGASVSATSGNAIISRDGNTNIIMNSGSSVTGSIILGNGDDEILLAGGDFSGITQISGDGDAIVAGTNDRLTFTGSTGVFDQTRIQGIDIVTIDNGSTMALTFQDNRFNASALNNSALIVQNGGILNASNGFALIGNLINSSGVVSMQNNSIDTPASISGNYTGGGQLILDVNFATNTADRLNIAGNVLAGGTSVGVRDISTGPATGAAITLVSVGGTTVAGDFTLAAPVVNGAFSYNNLALVGNDWVLQSIANTPTPGTPSTPVFTPFAASFESFSQSLITLESLSSFYQRTQERIGGSGNLNGANSGDALSIDSPVWVRLARGYREIDSNSSTTGANFDTNHWRGQIGIDFPLVERANGQFIVGINAGYGQADTSIRSTAGRSNIDTDNYSIGLSGTWIAQNGLYVDTQLQRSWYKSDLSAGGVGAGDVNNVDGDGYAVSIEVGKEMQLNDTFTITPQVQLAYANVDTDSFRGANAEVVRVAEGKSLRARIGALLGKRFTEDGASNGFVIANVIREFEDATRVNVSGAQLTNVVDRYTGELGLGVQHAWSKGTTQYELQVSVTGSTSLNNFGDSNAAQGQVAFKANF